MMRCHICDNELHVEEIKPDPWRPGKFKPCRLCLEMINEALCDMSEQPEDEDGEEVWLSS